MPFTVPHRYHICTQTSVQLVSILTHWGRDKMAAIFQTTFSNGCSWMKIFEFWIQFDWSLFLRVQLIRTQHWFRISDNGLVLISQQAITWTNDGQSWWHIYASLGFYELMPRIGSFQKHQQFSFYTILFNKSQISPTGMRVGTDTKKEIRNCTNHSKVDYFIMEFN